MCQYTKDAYTRTQACAHTIHEKSKLERERGERGKKDERDREKICANVCFTELCASLNDIHTTATEFQYEEQPHQKS